MSAHFKCIITLFVVIGVVIQTPIDCKFIDAFKDCSRICLSRFPTVHILRRSCNSNCKLGRFLGKIKVLVDNMEMSTPSPHELNNFTKVVPQAPMEPTENVPGTKKLTENVPVEPIENVSDPSEQTQNGTQYSRTFKIKYYSQNDQDNYNDPHKPIIINNIEIRPRGPTFTTIPQPDHCGYKSTKDMHNSNLLGGAGMGRIVGGEDANDHEFPWVVSIQYYKDQSQTVHFCGGAIISKNYILTAAHCMDRFVGKERSVVVKVGVMSPDEQPSLQHLTVSKVIVHEGWDSNRQINDISLIRVQPDIKFTKTDQGQFTVNLLCLPKGLSDPEGMAVLAGWGEEAFKTGTPAEWLQKVTVPFVERDKCAEIYRKYLARVVPDSKVKVLLSHVCAGGTGGEDACRGDSGGALIQSKGRQSFHLGIVSFSVPCAMKDLPTIYTNVISYMDWISRYVKED